VPFLTIKYKRSLKVDGGVNNVHETPKVFVKKGDRCDIISLALVTGIASIKIASQ
jgi:hypothetical protein